MKDDSKPVFYNPRVVPYALRGDVAAEIDRLVKEGTIEKFFYSDSATPFVAILKKKKKKKSVITCSNYKVTVYLVLGVTEYPLSTTENVFQMLTGGQKFTRLIARTGTGITG